MAPEYPPSLVLFDARWDKNVLKGVLEYVEAGGPNSERLRVRWSVEGQPEDFRAVGGGVAYVYDKGGHGFTLMPISEEANATNLGNSRYQWTEGLQCGLPWLMFILVLPEGYTLVDPQPDPVGTKVFRNRLALYWTLKGDDDFRRTKVECTIKQFQGDVRSELMRINKNYLAIDPAEIVEDRQVGQKGNRSVEAIPDTPVPERLPLMNVLGVAVATLAILGVLTVGLVWVAKQISNIPLLVLIFSVAVVFFLTLVAVVLLISGHLSEKVAEKLFLGILGKIPGFDKWLPKLAIKK